MKNLKDILEKFFSNTGIEQFSDFDIFNARIKDFIEKNHIPMVNNYCNIPKNSPCCIYNAEEKMILNGKRSAYHFRIPLEIPDVNYPEANDHDAYVRISLEIQRDVWVSGHKDLVTTLNLIVFFNHNYVEHMYAEYSRRSPMHTLILPDANDTSARDATIKEFDEIFKCILRAMKEFPRYAANWKDIKNTDPDNSIHRSLWQGFLHTTEMIFKKFIKHTLSDSRYKLVK